MLGFPSLATHTPNPCWTNFSRFLASHQQPDMFGLNAAELPEVFLRSGAKNTVSEHKSASISYSLSKIMALIISEGKEVLLIKQFLREVIRHPRLALECLKKDCKDQGLLLQAESMTKRDNSLEQAEWSGGKLKKLWSS